MTFEELSHQVTCAGYSWAVEGHPGEQFSAVVVKGSWIYIGDTLATGLGCKNGDTPTEALQRAFDAVKSEEQ